MWSDLPHRLRALVRRRVVERDLDEELQFHFERQVEKHLQRGLDRPEAVRRARLTFGGMEQLKEECRDARGVLFVETLLQDSRYALRMMRRYPAFAAMAVLLIGLGIGASTSMFSLVAATVLRRSPFSDRLVYLWRIDKLQNEPQERLPLDVLDIGGQSRSLERFAAYRPDWFLVSGPNGSQRVYGYYVQANWVVALGIVPGRGRNFLPEEERAGRDDVVILSDALWKRMFNRSPSALGSRIRVQSRVCAVVGILPATFELDRAELFTPFLPQHATEEPGFFALANLRSGINLARAQSEVDSIVAGLAQRLPEYWKNSGIELVTPDMRVSYSCGPTCIQAHRGIWLLFGAVGMVLLMACANVANLLLARSVGRRREFLIRAAIGCSRLRLLRQNLTESMVLFACGGALGILIAWWSKALLARIAAAYIETTQINLDGRVLAFSVTATLLTGLVFGLLPAMRSIKGSHGVGGLAAVSVQRNLTRRFLVSAEFTLSLVLLIGFGLLLRSFLYVESIPVGIRTDRLLTTATSLTAPEFKDPARKIMYTRTLLDRVREIPGVEAAVATSDLPLTGAGDTNILIEGISSTDPQGTEVRYISASPELFTTLGIPLLEGRTLSPHDTETAAPVVVINKTMAQTFFPTQSAVGRHIRTGQPPVWREIVGVVADVRQRNLEEDSRPVFYRPYFQGLDDDLSIALRTRSQADMPRVAQALRQTVREADSQQPWDEVKSMQQIIYDSESLSLRRPVVRLLGAFGLLAVILAALGLYAVLAYSVTERTREIGIRMALGASRRQVLGQIGLDTIRLIAPGATIGVLASYWLSSLLPSGHIGWSGSGVFLYGVSRLDAVTYLAVMTALVSVSMFASFVPARRAMQVDPAASLRHE
jgi:putative ABC transport system permease protein